MKHGRTKFVMIFVLEDFFLFPDRICVLSKTMFSAYDIFSVFRRSISFAFLFQPFLLIEKAWDVKDRGFIDNLFV